MNDKNWTKVLIGILVFSACFRFFTIDYDREISSPDEFVYHYAAENIIKYKTFTMDRDGEIFSGNKAVIPASNLQVGYPLFVALMYTCFGHSVRYIFYMQGILSLLDIYLLYKIMCQLKLSKKAIGIALFFAACYPGFIFNINRLLTEQLFKTLLILFVFFFLKAMNLNRKRYFILAAFFCGYATLVRGLALPFFLLGVILILLYQNCQKIRDAILYVGSFLLTQSWWWIRNLLVFNRFILLSDAGENPKIWGMMPYYLDMASANNNTVKELLQAALEIDATRFFKWRIFGIIQYMWGDIWDENLVHSGILYYLLFLQIIVVFCVILSPVLIKKATGVELFILSFPCMFTIMNMPYHGLPRYVYPAISFVVIIMAMLIDKVFGTSYLIRGSFVYIPKNIWSSRIDKIIKYIAIGVTICFSFILFYSVFIFAWTIEDEMSNWRLEKYCNTDVKNVEKIDKRVQSIDIDGQEIIVSNAGVSGERGYRILNDYPIININIKNTENTNRNIVSKITIAVRGGYLYDKMTVYWKKNDTENFNENMVYSFPINIFEKKHIIYIDGDITELMIVPIVFRGGTFAVDFIEVDKYIIGEDIDDEDSCDYSSL